MYYGAAKSALGQFLEGLRHRLFGSSIRVVDIAPGFIDTPMTSHIRKSPLFAAPQKVAPIIVDALLSGNGRNYVPGFWRWIMFVVRHLPNFVFYRTKF